MPANLRPEGYQEFLKDLRDGHKFKYSRFGDGEWTCILQTRPGKTNCNGDLYTPDLGTALGSCFLRAESSRVDSRIAITPMATRQLGPKIDEWLNKYVPNQFVENRYYDGGWPPREQIRAHRKDHPFELLAAIQEHPLILVGPKHLANVQGLKFDKHIVTPDKNAWPTVHSTLATLVTTLSKMEGAFVSVSMGMAACVLIDKIPDIVAQNHWLWDMGSLLDPLAGVQSRLYHRDIM